MHVRLGASNPALLPIAAALLLSTTSCAISRRSLDEVVKKPGVRLKTVGGPGVRIEWLDWDLIEAEHHRLHPRSSTFEIKTTWTGTAGWNCLTGWAPAGPESRIRPACWMSRATLGRDPPEFEPLDRGRGSLFDHPDDGLTRGRAVMGGVLIAYCLTVSLICQRRLRR